MSGYRIQNTPQELRNIPSYYQEALTPLERHAGQAGRNCISMLMVKLLCVMENWIF